MGYVGACISTIITEGILLILLMHFISEYLAKISTTHIIKMPIFAGLIMALSIFFIKEYLNIMIVILIAGIVYFVSLLILGGITREDKRLLRRIISGDA
jgi:VIT1/CCC1 family predicted Fe2+/Mn2+ transporter